jgi:hypothetical protein
VVSSPEPMKKAEARILGIPPVMEDLIAFSYLF